jgi:hypothetical protein
MVERVLIADCLQTRSRERNQEPDEEGGQRKSNQTRSHRRKSAIHPLRTVRTNMLSVSTKALIGERKPKEAALKMME